MYIHWKSFKIAEDQETVNESSQSQDIELKDMYSELSKLHIKGLE